MKGRTSLAGSALAALLSFALAGAPAVALEKVKMSTFQANLCCFTVYVAQQLKLFEKHGVEVELLYGTGIQVANIMVSGSAEVGAFAVEHGVTVAAKGQDLKLLVLNQQLPPLGLIVHAKVPTPNADKPYPEMIRDMKGLKIGISSAGASTDTTLQYLLREAGLDPKKDVTIIPVGDPNTMLAALKNGVIDGAMAVEPTQTIAVHGLNLAKMVVDIEGGGAPLFKEYAYNGMFVRSAFLKDRPQVARGIVDAVVEAEQAINDPSRADQIMQVGAATLKGVEPTLLRAYLERYRTIFRPVATAQALANVNAMLRAGNL
ncbi:MAG: ABC transporter substrate-binding protein, partial [Acetobacteraceae bacterium]|nr:ABC transporter substrate-binding protein [Acetobacteraceae bacterium]